MAADALFAGVICGHIVALFSAPLIARMLLQLLPETSEGSGRQLPAIVNGLNPVMLAVPVFVFGTVLWSLAGFLFGILFIAVHRETSPRLPATPDILYAAVAALLVVQFTVLATVLIRRLHWTVLSIGLLSLVLFGWVLPNVALLNQR